MLCITSGRVQAQTTDGQTVAAGTGKGTEDIVVTARLANASINGIAIDPIRLPQNVRVLDSALIQASGATRIDDLLDLSGSVSRQNNSVVCGTITRSAASRAISTAGPTC